MTGSIWMLHAKKADFNALSGRFHISPVTARIIRNRDIESEAEFDRYLNGSLEDLYSPGLLPDMEEAVQRICRAVQEKRRLRIVGDYDIDGVCSTAILYKGFKRIGACADYVIPERIRDGYGINEHIIEAAAADGIQTIVTCDNAIAAISQIALAKELGLEVIITDHHDIQTNEETGEDLMPPADVIVNPKRRDSLYPFPDICGGMVAYKLVQVLYEVHKIPGEEWLGLLEIAAIATVGDVMKLQGENRIIVKEGLSRLEHTSNLGLRKLIEKNNLQAGSITAYHIGFVIGPCLNAGGRLKSAKIALRMLLAETPEQAGGFADELKELNDMRKDMTAKGEAEAIEQVENKYMDDKVLVVFLPECHESLAGIIAGRLREHFNKPSFVLTRGETMAKGSGRSIEQYHMYQGLCGVADLLAKFGGHPMAAGLSLEEKNIDEFRRQLNAKADLSAEDFVPRIWIDVPMPFEYVNEKIVQELKELEPFGQGNEKPLFAQKGLMIRNSRVLGKNRNVVKMNLVTDTGHPVDGLLFTDGDRFLDEQAGRNLIDMIYYPDVNEYNGTRTLQAVIKNYKFH